MAWVDAWGYTCIVPIYTRSGQAGVVVRLASGWSPMLIYYERKIPLSRWWLVLI
jgi:hypothetical protein